MLPALLTAKSLHVAQTIHGVVEGADALWLKQASQSQPILYIALDDTRLASLVDLIAFFSPETEVVSFPSWDCLPYDRISPNPYIVGERVQALCRLLQPASGNRVIVTTVNSILQRVPPREYLSQCHLNLKINGTLKLKEFQTFCVDAGYQRTDTVREEGEFSIRGSIIDLFPSGFEDPIRIDLFGDTIESLRIFDPATQVSGERIASIDLKPAREISLNIDAVELFRTKYRDQFGVPANDPLYDAISEARIFNGMDHWLPLFYKNLETVFDYAGSCRVVCDDQVPQAILERLAQIEDFYLSRKDIEKAQIAKNKGSKAAVSAIYHPLPPDSLYLTQDELQHYHVDMLSPYAQPGSDIKPLSRRGHDFVDARSLGNDTLFKKLTENVKTHMQVGRKVLVACYSEGSRERLSNMMLHASLSHLKNASSFDEAQNVAVGDIALVLLALERGFETDTLAIISEQDILGDRLTRMAKRKRKSDMFLKEVSALSPGDLVVHIDHGIGRFEGLETVKAADTLHDCLKLTYDGGDRLFVPVENIEVLTRFGHDEGLVPLDKLGGVAWQARKAKIKKDLMQMADALLKIAAERTIRISDRYTVTKDIYDPFVSRFPYQETDDQLKAINDVIVDLDSGKPMDRLVCGDVGFGKTEIALRAAYIVAASGAQVAVIVPTTLLSRQHTENFTKRFANFGIRVAQLSRFVTSKEAKLVKAGLENGSIQVVVGTHALLAKDIKFAHLGLVIVDEEQRFGVKQKEKLKELKADVHVLTLTATPIPRTLQMSLTGVRDMSIIASAPVDRLAIRTFVLPFDGLVIREAIMRERFRGGQTFYVCPRISDLVKVEDVLRGLVPEVKVISAHGQMTPTELEDRMSAFYDGQYDVLLATNIIESGLDIPRANTLIVHNADLFGLAQLYQIRGRVGRSKVRAYAYLTTDPAQKLSKLAAKRLEVIEMLDTLGSGFQLAAHDMDIRGSGNLLGEEQSGHIREVGVELYQQMLEDAVAAARAGVSIDDIQSTQQDWSPAINIGTSVLIPETYVEDLAVRLSLYRRLGDIQDDTHIEQIAAEFIDRFGPLPPEVQNLFDIVALKQLCKIARISKVEAGPKGAVISFYQDRPTSPEALLTWISGQKGAVKIRPDQKISVIAVWDSVSARLKGVKRLVSDLAGVGKRTAA